MSCLEETTIESSPSQPGMCVCVCVCVCVYVYMYSIYVYTGGMGVFADASWCQRFRPFFYFPWELETEELPQLLSFH